MRRNSKSEQEFLGQLIDFLTDLKGLLRATNGGEVKGTVREALNKIDVAVQELKMYMQDAHTRANQATAHTRATEDRVELFERFAKAAKSVLEILDMFFGSS